MSKIIFLFSLVIFIPLIQTEEKKEEEIKFVFQMHRHGARAPFTGVENGKDCYKEDWISNGELSEVGKRQHYLLGVRNRKRYMDDYKFLNKNYDPQEILIYSTNVKRTIQSIYSQLQGLYPEGYGKEIPINLNDEKVTRPKFSNYTEFFQEIEEKYFSGANKYYALPNKINVAPVHIFYLPDHQVQLHDYKNCPKLKDDYFKMLNKSDIVQNFRDTLKKEFRVFFESLEGQNDTFLNDYWDIYKYMDTLKVDETDGRNLEAIIKLLNDSQIKRFRELSDKFLFMDYYNINFYDVMISQISMTNTMRVIIKYMDDIVQNKKDKSKVKYLIYSMHDTTFGAMEVFNNLAFNTSIEYANFAENGFYELYKINNTFKVRLIIKDKIRDDMNYTVFKEKVEKKLYSDEQIKEKCKWQIDNKKNKSNILKITIICLIAFNMVLILLIVCNLFYKKAQKQDIML
jgi:hypothetical protein